MNQTQKIFSDDFTTRLIELSEGFFTPEKFELLISGFETEAKKYYQSPASEANFLRILNSLFDRISFFQDCLKYPHHSEIIIAISYSSNYLTDIVVRNPEFLYQVFDNHYLTKSLKYEEIENELRAGIQKFKSYETRLNYLRQFKKRITLKIGLCDILNIWDLNLITINLSFLAKSIITVLFELSYAEILEKYGAVDNKPRYCLFALGKLGGRELNYSSDTDFILFYDANSPINNKSGKEYFELLSEAALLFIQSSTAMTNRGYIYRVDFRLRPDGKNSPLCKAAADYIRYYETRGEDWERQMLIKMDFTCGNPSLYDDFAKYLQTYIYPGSFSSSITEQILRMKSNIEKHNPEKGNIKTFEGGIRNIEFVVQGLQLLNGGKTPAVRSGNTLETLGLISDINLLAEDETNMLKEAYIFYRRTEHFLQLMNDNQTHLIPQSGEILYKLANYMGFDNPDSLKEKIEDYRRNVIKIYNETLRGELPQENKFDTINFTDRTRALRNLEYLSTGKGLFEQKEFDSRTIEAFRRIEGFLFKYLSTSISPDKVLENFVKILKTIKLPSIWYSEFINEKFFVNFLYLCEYSQKSVNLMMFSAGIREMFLSRRVFVKNHEDFFAEYGINEVMFVGSVQFALKLIDHSKLSNLISSYIDFTINRILKASGLEYNYMISGLGSYGTGEMSFGSDVDLLVVVDTIEGHPEIQNDFQNFLQSVRTALNQIEVDFRLRPEGKKSQLVWDIKNYSEYIITRCRVWEFQALRKMRFISGDKKLYNKLKNAAVKRIAGFDQAFIRSEIKSMYNAVQKEMSSALGGSLNIKKEKGALQTIEFALSQIVMCNPGLYRSSFGKGIPKLIKSIEDTGPGKEMLSELSSNYKLLKTIEAASQNILDSGSPAVPENEEKVKGIYSFLNFTVKSEFFALIKSTLKFNSQFYERQIEKNL